MSKIRAHGRFRPAQVAGRVRTGITDDKLRRRPRHAFSRLEHSKPAVPLALAGRVVVDGVRVFLGAQAEVNAVTELLRVSIIRIIDILGVRRPADLESSLWLVAIGIDPETFRLIGLVAVGVHVAFVPGTTTRPSIVARDGVFVAPVLIAPGGCDPGYADGVVVGREQRVHALVVVLDVGLANVSVVHRAGVCGHADELSKVVPNTAGSYRQNGVLPLLRPGLTHMSGRSPPAFVVPPGPSRATATLKVEPGLGSETKLSCAKPTIPSRPETIPMASTMPAMAKIQCAGRMNKRRTSTGVSRDSTGFYTRAPESAIVAYSMMRSMLHRARAATAGHDEIEKDLISACRGCTKRMNTSRPAWTHAIFIHGP